jgi:hypothetical protein
MNERLHGRSFCQSVKPSGAAGLQAGIQMLFRETFSRSTLSFFAALKRCSTQNHTLVILS